MAIKAIIFDIDGVLADSRKAVATNTKQLLAEFGFLVADTDVENMSTAHSADSVLLSLAPSLNGNGELLKKMLRRLSELSAENIGLVRPFPLAGKLPALSGRYLLAAATNRKASAMMVLEELGISKYFKAVATSKDAPPKPNPEMIKIALRKLGVESQEAVFVGDNDEDVEAGRKAGVRTIMLYGGDVKACEKFEKEFLQQERES